MSSNKEWHLQPPSKTRYGYNGLLQKFAFLDINASDWIIKKLDIERGGIEFI